VSSWPESTVVPDVALWNKNHNISDHMSRISPELLPDVFAIIQVIETGTLTAAARELGISHPRA